MLVLITILVFVMLCYRQHKANAAKRKNEAAARLFLDREVAEGTVYPIIGRYDPDKGAFVKGSSNRFAEQSQLEWQEAHDLICAELERRGMSCTAGSPQEEARPDGVQRL